MSTFTDNYTLIKPDEEDYYDVADFNENMDTLDAAMASVEEEVAGVSDKIGTSADGETVFSALNNIQTAVGQGTSLVKSIQRTECDISTRNANTTLNITPVDTSHSFVIMDQYSHISQTYTVRYTLNSDTLYVETSSDYTQTIKLGFWIIEFY